MIGKQSAAGSEDGASPQVVYVPQAQLANGGISEVDVARLLSVICRRKWWIAAFTAVLTSAGVAYAWLATPFYRAEAIVLQRESNAGVGLSTQLSGLSGLAGLAGLTLGSGGNKQEPLGLMRSKGFARRFIESNGLLDELSTNRGAGIRVASRQAVESLDIREVVDEFSRSVLRVEEDKKTGLIIVSVTWTDPVAAAAWANQIVAQANNELRARALRESEDNISYLTEQLLRTDIVSIQQSISRVLESEMQKLLLAKGNGDYAFRVLDVAETPLRRSKPKRALIVVMAFAVGLVASVFLVLTIDPIRRVIAAARRR